MCGKDYVCAQTKNLNKKGVNVNGTHMNTF